MLTLYMAALRTQIYLTAEQRERLDRLRLARGGSLAELIREAVDDFLDQEGLDPPAVLDATFGSVPDALAADRGAWAERPGSRVKAK